MTDLIKSDGRMSVSGSFPRLDFNTLSRSLIKWLLVTRVQWLARLMGNGLMSRALTVPLDAAPLSPLSPLSGGGSVAHVGGASCLSLICQQSCTVLWCFFVQLWRRLSASQCHLANLNFAPLTRYLENPPHPPPSSLWSPQARLIAVLVATSTIKPKHVPQTHLGFPALRPGGPAPFVCERRPLAPHLHHLDDQGRLLGGLPGRGATGHRGQPGPLAPN